MPRSGNASGGGQPGWAVKCAPGGPNDYVYVIVQPVGWEPLAELIGRPELADDPEWATPEARLPKLDKMFQLIEEWTSHAAQVGGAGRAQRPQHPVRADPVDQGDHRGRVAGRQRDGRRRSTTPSAARFTTVGSPLKLSDSPVEVTASPLLGEHNEEVYVGELGLAPRSWPTAQDERSDLTMTQDRTTDRTLDKAAVRAVLDAARAEGRTALTAPEGKRVADAYGIADAGRGAGRVRGRGGGARRRSSASRS